mmetsp:Transcript_42946/g.94081  ORF Transcript_42946/g.94081 Transcript_42946/m.94081 type:complete len:328 (-) Transcript_42946:657-1640(-)
MLPCRENLPAVVLAAGLVDAVCDRVRAVADSARDGHRKPLDELLVKEVEKVVVLAAVHTFWVEDAAEHLVGLRLLAAAVGGGEHVHERAEHGALWPLPQHELAQQRRLVLHARKQHLERAQPVLRLGPQQAAHQRREAAVFVKLAVEGRAVVQLQLLGDRAELLQKPEGLEQRLRLERRVGELVAQRLEEDWVGAEGGDDLHVVVKGNLVERGKGVVVERAGQHHVLKKAEPVVLVDLLQDRLVRDRHNLFEAHHLGEEDAVPDLVSIGLQFGVVLERADDAHHEVVAQKQVVHRRVVEHHQPLKDVEEVVQIRLALQILRHREELH